MSLKEKLDAIRAGGAKMLPAETLEIMHAETEKLRASGAAERSLGVGASLPPFELANQRGETVRSADLLARGPLVLTVYRGVW